jgi:hypothetical protein
VTKWGGGTCKNVKTILLFVLTKYSKNTIIWPSNVLGPAVPRLSTCSLLYNRYLVSFLGVKRPERGVNYQTTSSAEVKERVELYFYSLSLSGAFMVCYKAEFTFTFYVVFDAS